MSKHTTGPWYLERTIGMTGDEPPRLVAENGKPLGTLWIDGPETLANARLILAAPLLLTALRTLAYANSDEEKDYPDRQLFEIVKAATDKALSLIQHIEGDKHD